MKRWINVTATVEIMIPFEQGKPSPDEFQIRLTENFRKGHWRQIRNIEIINETIES